MSPVALPYRVGGIQFLLTASHIASLGGVERVREEAPVGTTEAWESDSGQAWWLELANPPTEVTDELLMRLRDYFEPLLIPKMVTFAMTRCLFVRTECSTPNPQELLT